MEEINKMTIQKKFLKKLESVIPANTTLAVELADILQISSDSSYRRLRGETALTIDEVALLCEKFKISIDSLNSSEIGLVTFRYNILKNDESSFRVYLESLLLDLQMIKASKEKKIVYACEDIPVFHNFNYPLIAAFKMFYWMKSILNVPSLQGEFFEVKKIPEEFYSLGRQIFALYASIPSIEIWTETTINSTLKQIEFYFDAGIFNSKQDALLVCETLRNELNDIQKQAEAGRKFVIDDSKQNIGSDYTVYFSEIEITNNCVLVEMGDVRAVYLGHLTFNTMSTTNNVYCKETELWFNGITKKSTLISGISEKHRYQFFKKCFSQLEKLVSKIESI